MFRNSSANRSTKIKLIEGGKVAKVINSNVNYSLEYDQFKKILEVSIRLSPQDPVYIIDKIILHNENNENIELNEAEMDRVLKNINLNDALTSKFHLTVSFIFYFSHLPLPF